MKTILFAAVALAMVLPTATLAQDSSVDAAFTAAALGNAPPVSAGQARFPIARPPSFDATSKPPVLVNFVTASPYVSSKLPCFDCVGNPAITNSFGLAIPTAEIFKVFTNLQYTVYFSDLNYTGNCTVAYAVTQGRKVLQSGSLTVSGLKPGFVDFVDFNAKKPAATGPATLAGSVKCGSTTAIDTETLYFD